MNRFYLAILAYAALAVLAGFTLDGSFRLVVWVFLGGLALKTWLVILRERQEKSCFSRHCSSNLNASSTEKWRASSGKLNQRLRVKRRDPDYTKPFTLPIRQLKFVAVVGCAYRIEPICRAGSVSEWLLRRCVSDRFSVRTAGICACAA
jgi:hypothetical protein